MRLIDAKELERQTKEAFKESPVVMGMLLRWIRKQSTIDPESLHKKGEWIPFENRWIGGIPWSGKECSHCRTTIGVRAEYNFCPNCGADMRPKEA